MQTSFIHVRPSSCEPIRVLAALSADGGLSETESRRLAAHLETCDSCRRFSDSVTALTTAIRDAPAEPAPVIASHRRPASAGRLRRHGRQLRRRTMTVSAVAASLAVAVLVGRATSERPVVPASLPVIVVDVTSQAADDDLAVVARDYANRRTTFGGDPPPRDAPGLRAG